MNDTIAVALKALDRVDLTRFTRALEADAGERETAKTLSSLKRDTDALVSASVKDEAWLAKASRFLADADKKLQGNAEADKKKKELQKAVSDARLRLVAERRKTAEAACRDFRIKYAALQKADLLAPDYPALLYEAMNAGLAIDEGDPLYAAVASAYREFQADYAEKRHEILQARDDAVEIDDLLKKSKPSPEDVFSLWSHAEPMKARIPNFAKLDALKTKYEKEKAAHEKEVKATVAAYEKKIKELRSKPQTEAWFDSVLSLRQEIGRESAEVRSKVDASFLDTVYKAADRYRTAFDYDKKIAAMCAKPLAFSDVGRAEELVAKVNADSRDVTDKMQNAAGIRTLQEMIRKAKNAEAERLRQEAERKQKEEERRRQEEKRKLDASIDECYARASRGDPEAMTQLALCYYEGHGVTKDFDEAFNWFEKAAKKGNALAMEKLGDCYMNGYGVEEDYRMAEKCYKKAQKLAR